MGHEQEALRGVRTLSAERFPAKPGRAEPSRRQARALDGSFRTLATTKESRPRRLSWPWAISLRGYLQSALKLSCITVTSPFALIVIFWFSWKRKLFPAPGR